MRFLQTANGLVTFTERETRACEVPDELTRWLMAEHLDRGALWARGLQPGVGGQDRVCRGQGRQAWGLYERMLRAAWSGQVRQVQEALREQLTRLGPPLQGAKESDPSKVVSSPHKRSCTRDDPQH